MNSKLIIFFEARLQELLCAILLATLLLTMSFPAHAQPMVHRGEYLVRRAPLARITGELDAKSTGGLADSIQELRSSGRDLSLVRQNLADAALSSADASAEIPYDSQAAANFCNSLIQASPDIVHCEPNFIYHTMLSPNDASFSSLWGMTQISAPQAWDSTHDAGGLIVAIVDTGVDYNHPDLTDNIWTNSGEIPGNDIDDDANGIIDDVHGINAINGSGDPMDDNGHGTHCAGTIGAVGNNSLGVAGIAWNVQLMGLKFLASNGSGSTSDAVTAIYYAIDHGADVISASWGGGGYSQELYDAIAAARDAGIPFVAAAGNESADNDSTDSYPANYDLSNVVSVAATDESDDLAWFSNFGASSVDLAAPGTHILSTAPGSGYQSLSGTSMATPHVAGALALIKAHNPGDDYLALISRALNGSDQLGSLSGYVRSGGRLNLAQALDASSSGGFEPIGQTPSTTRIDEVLGVTPSNTQLTGRIYTNRDVYVSTSGGEAPVIVEYAGNGFSASCSLGPSSGDFVFRNALKGTLRNAKTIRIYFGNYGYESRLRRLPRKTGKFRSRNLALATADIGVDVNRTCEAIIKSFEKL